ncbi:hypothetical protein [Roseivivax marinus]|uniref:hypothetical protein n=1 Tax=Roseivivax marinus TaxID=1379903 RepID=UPI00273E9BFF|nr:hypothetical protein [Roseivivax marinus]
MMEKIAHDYDRTSITEEQASPLAWVARGMKSKTAPEYRLPVVLVEAASRDAALNLQPAKILHLLMAEAQFSGSRSVIVPSAASRMVINAGRARARDAALALQELVLFVGVVGFTSTPAYALKVVDHVELRENEIEFVLSRQMIDALNATGPFARVDLRDVIACTKLPALALLPLVEYRRRHSRGPGSRWGCISSQP